MLLPSRSSGGARVKGWGTCKELSRHSSASFHSQTGCWPSWCLLGFYRAGAALSQSWSMRNVGSTTSQCLLLAPLLSTMPGKWAWNIAQSEWPSCTEQPGAAVSRKSLPKKSRRRCQTPQPHRGGMATGVRVLWWASPMTCSLAAGGHPGCSCQMSAADEQSNSPKTVKEKALFSECVERFKMWKWPSVKYLTLWKVDITILTKTWLSMAMQTSSVTPSFSTALIQHDLNNYFLSAFAILAVLVLLHTVRFCWIHTQFKAKKNKLRHTISCCTVMDGNSHIQKIKLWQVIETYSSWWHRKMLIISYHSRVKNVYSAANIVSFQQMQNSFWW